MGCFNCDDPKHMVNQCPKPFDSTRAAKRRMEYLAKKTGNSRNAHIVLFELCQQMDAQNLDDSDNPKASEAKVHIAEPEPDVGDFDLFDALVTTSKTLLVAKKLLLST